MSLCHSGSQHLLESPRLPTQCSIDIHHTVIQANTTTQAESAQANTITQTYTTTQTNTKNTQDRELFGDKRAGEVGQAYSSSLGAVINIHLSDAFDAKGQQLRSEKTLPTLSEEGRSLEMRILRLQTLKKGNYP